MIPNSDHFLLRGKVAFLKTIRKVQHFLLLLIFLCGIAGCSITPVDEQVLNGWGKKKIAGSRGSCETLYKTMAAHPGDSVMEGLPPHRITLVNWNIYKGQKSGWIGDLLRISSGSDILLLQEAVLAGGLVDFLQIRGLYWNFNKAFHHKGVGTGVLIASKVRPEEHCGTRNAEPVIGLPKTALINSFAIQGTGERLIVANIHGINFTLGTAAYKEQFGEIINILKRHVGPILVAGDFNNWTEKRNAIVDGLVEELGLTALSFEDDERSIFFGDPVDHILYRGLVPVAETTYEVTSSDHNPIAVTFKIRDH